MFLDYWIKRYLLCFACKRRHIPAGFCEERIGIGPKGVEKVSVFWRKIIICAINKDLREGDFGFED